MPPFREERFETPATSGWPGALIGWFKSADRPFNLAPSLHIAFRGILWVIYVRNTRGVLRASVKGWFVLIGISTLLVYQHHAIDVLGGQLLAMLCIYLVPEERVETPRGGVRRDIAVRYGLGAALCVAAGAAIGGWGWLMLWPAFSLALVAAAYLIANGDATDVEGAIERVRAVRRGSVFSGEAVALLREFAKGRLTL